MGGKFEWLVYEWVPIFKAKVYEWVGFEMSGRISVPKLTLGYPHARG